MNLGLTAAQIEARRAGIGSSDAARILSGDWFALWQEKTGRAESKSILSPWDAAVRHALEPVILDFYEIDTGHAITRRGESVVSVKYPFMRCILDGFDAAIPKVVDAKALNIYTPNPFQWCIEHYTPQMHHQIIVCEVSKAALHVSLGMKKPEPIEIEYDEFFAAQYIDRCREFWSYVEDDLPPSSGAPLAAPPPVEVFRKVDMTGNNAWGASAADWLANEKAAKTFKAAEKDLKALVEPDVGEAIGHGIVVKRDKRGLGIRRA